MRRFLLHLTLFTAALAAAIYLLGGQFGPGIIHPYTGRVLLLLAALARNPLGPTTGPPR